MNIDIDSVLDIIEIFSSCTIAICAIITLVRKESNRENVAPKKVKKDRSKKTNTGEETLPKTNNMKKKQPEFYIMTAAFLLLLIIFIWQLVSNEHTPLHPVNPEPDDTIGVPIQNAEPMLVFAGGGSVRNYLLGIDSSLLDVRNSINIAMASGSAWRVLPEEYHCRFPNEESGKSNKFTTICLSARKIETTGNFYMEYIPYLEKAIVVEVFLGDDPLVAYVSNDIRDKWKMKHTDSILLDTLAHKLQWIIKNKENVSIYTTNKTSGTLEQYKKSFQDLKYKTSFHLQDSMMLQDSITKLHLNSKRDTVLIKRIQKSIETRSIVDLEKMIDDKLAFTFYDMTPSNCIYSCYQEETPATSNENITNMRFIILGSKYYKVKEFDKSNNKNKINELCILDDERKPIVKPMYLYFLAIKDTNPHHDNWFIVDDCIVEFLKELDKRIKLPKQDVWNRIMKDGIIEYDKSEHNGKKIVSIINK